VIRTKDLREAVETILDEVTDGDVASAKWIVSHLDDVPTPLPCAIALGEGSPAEQARRVLTAVQAGTISDARGRRILGMIATAAPMDIDDQLAELRAALDEISGADAAVSDVMTGGFQTPTWGRLKAMKPQ
jgi:hypothetical protein